ncbi:hypothetical protein [Microvirga calopogonii]|uniref:hypothetical protein n=1 Tax=Microvirga calopogonii TaxID=2078013 RepID=UPI000E0CFE46|nr:hypothetical protein [Microvirga calopogonii]
MADHFKSTYYVLDPKGTVHRIKTKTIGELRALDSFRRQCLIHGYTAKDEEQVEADIEAKIYEQIFGGDVIKHEVQHAFLEANGTLVDHDNPNSFFGAIGYSRTLKDRCKRQHKRYMDDGKLPGGGFVCNDPAPYHVELPGFSA